MRYLFKVTSKDFDIKPGDNSKLIKRFILKNKMPPLGYNKTDPITITYVDRLDDIDPNSNKIIHHYHFEASGVSAIPIVLTPPAAFLASCATLQAIEIYASCINIRSEEANDPTSEILPHITVAREVKGGQVESTVITFSYKAGLTVTPDEVITALA